MKSTVRFLLISTTCLLINLSTRGQASFQDFLQGGSEDANTLMTHYMTPVLKGLGSGFNNGWYNTAKAHKPLGFDISFAFNAATVPTVDKSFEFVQTEFNNTYLANGSSTLPTIVGGQSSSTLEVREKTTGFPITSFQAPSGIAADLPLSAKVPTPVAQIGLGIYKKTEVKIRFFPSINTNESSFKYFGIGVMHSVSQWIPAFKDLPVDISGLIGYTKLSIDYAIPPGPLGTGQSSTFDVKSFTFQAVASAHVAVLTGYIGVGLNKYNTSMKMLGDYILASDPLTGNPLTLTDPVNMKVNHTGMMATFGARLKLAIFSFNVDYSLQQYKTLSLGFGLTVR